MREDMKKVLTERPRYGHGRSYHDVRQAENSGDFEDLPTHQGMRVPYTSYDRRKEFTDHIMPLIRYLWSSIGKSWDGVWAEVCKTVPGSNTVDQHLRGHILQEVDIECEIIDGEVYTKPTGRWWSYRTAKPRGLYVDPRDGVLKAGANDYHNSQDNSFYRDRRKKADPTVLTYDDFMVAQINGIWYRYDYAVCKEPEIVTYFDEAGEEKTKRVIFSQFDQYLGSTVHTGTYRTNKRQLSSRDLKRLGLKNTQAA